MLSCLNKRVHKIWRSARFRKQGIRLADRKTNSTRLIDLEEFVNLKYIRRTIEPPLE